MKKHTSHPVILARLKRAQGHLASILTMVEAGRECADIAQQLQAVERALGSAKRELVQDHIEHCLEDSRDHRASVAEMKSLAKYLA